ncbi:hypothetical protein GQ53DRAFT_823800, partial [Thozetella sp. PMI_491]
DSHNEYYNVQDSHNEHYNVQDCHNEYYNVQDSYNEYYNVQDSHNEYYLNNLEHCHNKYYNLYVYYSPEKGVNGLYYQYNLCHQHADLNGYLDLNRDGNGNVNDLYYQEEDFNRYLDLNRDGHSHCYGNDNTSIKKTLTTTITPPPATVTTTTTATLTVSPSTPMLDVFTLPFNSGLKQTLLGVSGVCMNLGQNPYRSGKAKPGFTCTVFAGQDCSGQSVKFGNRLKNFPATMLSPLSWRCS